VKLQAGDHKAPASKTGPKYPAEGHGGIVLAGAAHLP